MVLYHLFTQHAPYLEKDLDSLRKKQIVAFPVRPKKLNSRISSGIDKLIQELTHKDPQVRPSSVEYAVAALRAEIDSTQVLVPRFRSVIVGRDSELASFRNLLHPILEDPGARFIGISGVSGIGKTGLMEQFESIVKVNGARAYVINHHSGSGILEPFTQLLHRVRGESEVPVDLLSHLMDWHQNGIKPKDFAQDFVQFLTQISHAKPIVLCVNDLQWMDEGSLMIYRTILNDEITPITVVGNYRTDELPGHWAELKAELSGRQVFTDFKLKGLNDEEVKGLITNLLGDGVSEGLYRKILSQCSGNPFYIYEYLRALQETKELAFRSGRWQWKSTPNGPAVPVSVVDSISSRLNAIGRQDRDILEYLSLLGRPIHTSWLAQVLESNVESLDERLAVLERLDMVSVSGSLIRPNVLLTHDWLGRVVRQSLTENRKRAIHHDWADLFEVEYQEENSPLLREALVRHLLGAGERLQVSRHIWEVIERLGQGHLYKDAADLAEWGFDSHAIRMRDGERVIQVAELFYLSGRLDKSLNLCQRVLSSQTKLTDQQLARLCSLQARSHLIKGQTRKTVMLSEKAISLLKSEPSRELLAEIQGDLLCALVHLRELRKAERVAEGALQTISTDETGLSRDKLGHALSHYYQIGGDLSQAIRWEVGSIRTALEKGNIVRSAGRIGNLALFFLETGRLARAEKLSRYSLGLGEDLDNKELVMYAKEKLCMYPRKLGRHQESTKVLNELSSTNQRENQNSYIQIEACIELAKNFNSQLFPEFALHRLGECQQMLEGNWVDSSFVDSTIALGWTWLLLGRPEEALTTISRLRPREIPRDRGRYLLLQTEAHLLRGHYGRAWQAACKADDAFPSYMTYYRSKVRLVQGRILLKRDGVEEAEKYIQEGLSIAKEEFYFPMMVEGWTLYAEYLSASGNPSRARTYCLRALQVAAKVERPALHVEVFRTLGGIEAKLGNREIAVRRYSQALQILKERLLHISPSHREAFTKQFILPIEADRDRILPEASKSVPRHFVQLRHLASLIRETRHHGELGKKALKIVRESLPSISANLLLKKPPSEGLAVVASVGRCGRTGKELVAQSWDGEQLVLPQSVSGVSGAEWDSLGIPLCCNGHLLGLLYVEGQGQGISEDELDFLSCVASILELQLANPSETRKVDADSGDSLMLDEARVIVGRHASMQELFAEIQSAASSDSTVLVVGESGTGKELVAQGIHELSDRQQERFLPVNCSALPPDLIESELFGHSRRSFTGAVEG